MDKALQAVDLLDQQGAPIPHNMVLDLMQRCSKRKDLVAGRQVHSILAKNGLDTITILGNHLIRMFTSCGSLIYANEAFHNVTKPDAYTWNAIISAHAKLGHVEGAFDFYRSMQNSGIKPNIVTFLCVLKACGTLGVLGHGRLVHDHIIRSGLRGDLVIENTLIDMYAKSGSLEEAKRVFDGLLDRDVVSWGAIVTGYVQHEHGLLALELFEKMHQVAVKPSKVIYLSALKACTITSSLDHGRQIHDYISRNELKLDKQLGSTLVDMYAKCGSLQEAHKVFDTLLDRDVVLWCSLITGYADNGYGLHVLELFEEMQVALQPDRVTFVYILKACGGIGALKHGQLIHDEIIRSRVESDKAVGNSLVDMYAKCGDFEGAYVVFSMLLDRDVVSWGAMIAGYVQQGHDLLALKLYEEMQMKVIKPDKIIFLFALKACGSLGALLQGNLIHQQIVEAGLQSDVVVMNALIDMYAKCKGLEEANNVFENLPNKNIDSWDAIIAAYSSHAYSIKALELFEKVHQEGLKPTNGMFLCILKVFGSMKAVKQGRHIHDELIRNELELGGVIGNTLVDMYAKCGSLKEARKVFEGLPKHNNVLWGAMIAGYVTQGKGYSALKLFEKMQLHDIKPNEVVFSCVLKACSSIGDMEQGRLIHDRVIRSGLFTNVIWNTLVDLYAKCGSIDEAQKVFDSFSDKNVVAWGALISGYTLQSNGLRVLDLYKKMQLEDVKPNKAVLLCCLQACGSIGALVEGRLVYEQIIEDGFESDVQLGNTLIDMYAKCGSMQEACNVFAMLPTRDMVSWGVMMAGFVRNGQCRQVEHCFENMQQQGLKPGEFIFTSILAACGHAGLLVEGLKYFSLMMIDHALLPGLKHYSCMSDLLGRAGCLCEAIDLLQTMPMAPDIILWTSLLSSCRTHGNKKLGTQCFEELLNSDPDDASWYVLMSNIYADAYMWVD